jgi:hypothetical protein
LIDTQALVVQASLGAVRLREAATPLAGTGPGLHNALRANVPAAGRRWTVSVDGGSLSTLDRALPWLILAGGLASP